MRNLQITQSSDTPGKRFHIVFLLGLLIVGVLTALWGATQAGQPATNLLPNPEFEDALAGWESFEAGGSLALKPAIDNPSNTVLAMRLPGSEAQSWIAIKNQALAVTPGQTYRLAVTYRLPREGQSPAKMIVRVVQVDQAGNPIKQDEISDPNQLATTLDSRGQLVWSELSHTFVADAQTAAVELYVALSGRQATAVEVDRVTFQVKGAPGWRGPVRTGLVILLVGLVLGIASLLLRNAEAGTASRVRRWGLVVLVNIALFLLLAELLALGLYFIREGGLFYTAKTPVPLIGTTEENVNPAADLAENLTARRFHPFFGFVVQPGADERFNNYGFISPYAYPFDKTDPNQYVIGIFGGSVAQIFTAEEHRTYFIQKLKEDDFFKDKEIVILNFAGGAYKQPQQSLILNYFLSVGQQFDAVINIDGFNEVAMSYINYQNGVDLSMPASFVMLPLMNLTTRTTPSPDTIESLAEINRLRNRLNDLADTLNRNRSAFLNLMLDQYYAFILRQYRAELAVLERTKTNAATSLIYVNPVESKLDETAVFEQIAQTWVNSSLTMHELLASRGIPYFHFLQPNQYYSDRTFSQAEAQTALNPDQVYRLGAEKGYPFLIEQFDTLTRSKVNFYSGLDIFDEEAEPVYGDDCCHYNERGNQILADFIAETMAETFP